MLVLEQASEEPRAVRDVGVRLGTFRANSPFKFNLLQADTSTTNKQAGATSFFRSGDTGPPTVRATDSMVT